MEDSEIISLFFSRSERAIAETASKYGTWCYRIARRIVACPEDAEECVQDTYLQVWDAIPPARPERFRAFLGRITRNLALDRLRFDTRQKRGGQEISLCYEELDGLLSGRQDSLGDQLALRQALEGFLSGLSPKARLIFLRRYWYFQPIQEIASSLHASQSSIKMTLLRTRNALKIHLEQEGLL